MKKKVLILYIIIITILICNSVYGAVTANLVLTSDKSSVKAGEDIIVSVNLRNISQGISSVTGYIDVDENVVNAVSNDMIVTNGSGKIEIISGGNVSSELTYVYNPSEPTEAGAFFNTNPSATNGHDLYFVEDFSTNISNDSTILKLKFKVKEGLGNGNLENAVRVSGLIAESVTMGNGSAPSEMSEPLEASLTIVVDNIDHEAEARNNAIARNIAEAEARNRAIEQNRIAEAEARNRAIAENIAAAEARNRAIEQNRIAAAEARNRANNNTNTSGNGGTVGAVNTNSSGNRNSGTSSSGDNTVAASRIPATGAKTVIIPVIVLCILGFVSYRKYMGYEDV